MQTEAVRAKTFNIRFSDEEWGLLDSLSEHYGLPAAGLIRWLLKKEQRAIKLEQAVGEPGGILGLLAREQLAELELERANKAPAKKKSKR